MAREAAFEAEFFGNALCSSCISKSRRGINICSVDLHVQVFVVAKFGSRGMGTKGGLISPSCNDSIGLILLVLEEDGLGVPFIDGGRGRVHPVDVVGEGRVDTSCEVADEGVVIGEPP